MPKSPSQPMNDTQYAQDWIEFLRHRNVILNFMWPVLLFVAVGSALMALYFQQLHEVTKVQLQNAETQLIFEKNEFSFLSADFDTLRDLNDELIIKIEALKASQAELSEQQSSESDINGKLVSALKTQIQAINIEKRLMQDAIDETSALLTQEKRVNELERERSKEGFASKVTDLNKQLSSRKIAYDALAKRQVDMLVEIDRLVMAMERKDVEIQSASDSMNLAQKRAASSDQEYGYLKTKYQNLEQRLQVMEPIGASSNSRKVHALATKADGHVVGHAGLDEIRAPVSQIRQSASDGSIQKSSESAAFDYGRIKVN